MFTNDQASLPTVSSATTTGTTGVKKAITRSTVKISSPTKTSP